MTTTYQKPRLTATLLLLAALLFSIKSWGRVTVEVLNYDLNEETKTAEVTGFSNGSVSNLEIPGSIQSGEVTYTVTSIGEYAFSQSNIGIVTIPASVETIGDRTFNMCSNLETVTFEEGSRLKSIGTEAFAGYEDDSNIGYDEWGTPYGEIIYPKSVISVMMITSCVFEQISFRFEGAMGFHCNGKAERKMTKRTISLSQMSRAKLA